MSQHRFDAALSKVLTKPVTGRSRRLIERLHIGLEVPSRQKDQSLRLKGTLVHGYGKVGDCEMIFHRHDEEQRCWRYKTDIGAAGSSPKAYSMVRSVTSLRHDGARAAAVSMNHL